MPAFKISSMKGILLFFGSVLILVSFQVSAHSNRPPVSVVGAVYGAVEQGRTGYGWLNASSEVEADSLFRQVCPKPNASGDIPICVPKDTSLEAAYNLAGQNFEAAFTSLALDNAYEQLILQRAAVSPTSNTWALPNCIAGSSRAKQMKQDLEDIKNMTDTNLNQHIRSLTEQITLKNLMPEAKKAPELQAMIDNLKRKKLLAIKLRATRQSFNSNRMAQAFLLDKQLEQAQNRTCTPGISEHRKCMSIRRNRDRMRLAFPSVFAGGLSEQESFKTDTDRDDWEKKTFATALEDVGARQCGTTPYTRFEASIYQLIGYNGAQNPIPGVGTGPGSGSGCATSDQDKAAITQGTAIVDTAFLFDSGYTMIVSDNDANADMNEDGMYSYAYTVGKGATAASDPRMATAFSNLTKAAEEMKSVQEMNAAVSMSTFCQDRKNLDDIGRLQPQALRQTVLDQNSDRSREALTRMMCQKGIMSKFQADDPTLDCQGVNGDPNGPEGMKINRTNFGFPFINDSNYTLKTLPDGTMEVSTKINYIFKLDPSIMPGNPDYLGDAVVPAANRKTEAQQRAEFTTNTAQWVQKSTAFMNTSAGAVKDPKVQFKIEQCVGCGTDVTPSVQVSPCYNRQKPAKFQIDFPGKTWDSHRCWYKMEAPPGSPPGTAGVPTRKYGDWQDAGNFTTIMDDSTIMHETGHNLSLADEYVADYYPANLVGEDGGTSGCNNSTMASNSNFCNVFYRRHLLEIVRPARVCPRP